MEPNQSFHSLKKEAQLRLTTLGQTARIQGVTSTKISVLVVMLRKAMKSVLLHPKKNAVQIAAL